MKLTCSKSCFCLERFLSHFLRRAIFWLFFTVLETTKQKFLVFFLVFLTQKGDQRLLLNADIAIKTANCFLRTSEGFRYKNTWRTKFNCEVINCVSISRFANSLRNVITKLIVRRDNREVRIGADRQRSS